MHFKIYFKQSLEIVSRRNCFCDFFISIVNQMYTQLTPNQKLSPTSCMIIAGYRGTLNIIIHKYTMIFSSISPIYARERHFLRYIIGDNYRRLVDDISSTRDDISQNFGRSPCIYSRFIVLTNQNYRRCHA